MLPSKHLDVYTTLSQYRFAIQLMSKPDVYIVSLNVDTFLYRWASASDVQFRHTEDIRWTPDFDVLFRHA